MFTTIVTAVLFALPTVEDRAADSTPPKSMLVDVKTRLWQAVLSPDGKTVVTITGDERTLKLWDVATGKARTWERGAADAGSVVFLKDGKSLLVGRRDGTISHHDFATGRELLRVKIGEAGKAGEHFFPLAADHNGSPAFDLNPDGTMLALGNPNGPVISLVKWPEGANIARLRQEPRNGEAWAETVRFGGDGKFMYCLCTGDARGFVAVWDVKTRKRTNTLLPARSINQMKISPDGRWVGAGGGFNRKVAVWDASADFRQIDLPIPTSSCAAIAFSRDGKRAATISFRSMGEKGARAVVWDLATARELRSWEVTDEYWHGGIAFFSHDGTALYLGGHREGLHAWNLSDEK